MTTARPSGRSSFAVFAKCEWQVASMVITADSDNGSRSSQALKRWIQDRSLYRPTGKAALLKTMIEAVDRSFSDVEPGIARAGLGDLLPDSAVAKPNFKHIAIAQRMKNQCIYQDTDKTQKTNRRTLSATL